MKNLENTVRSSDNTGEIELEGGEYQNLPEKPPVNEQGVERCVYWEECKAFCQGYRGGCEDYETADGVEHRKQAEARLREERERDKIAENIN
jgi:hypothetical protein